MQTLHHLGPTDAEAENEASLGHGVQTLRRHRRHGRHPGADLHDAGAELDVLGPRGQVSQRHYRIHAPGFRGPGLGHPHFVGGHGVVHQVVPVFAVRIRPADGN